MVDLADIRNARRDLDAVTREIRTIPGFRHFLAPPTFGDVAEAAREYPLAYVTAAEPGGLALVVRGSEVEHIPFRRLTADFVHARVQEYHAAYRNFKHAHASGAEAWGLALDNTTRWLWEEVMGTLVERVLPSARLAVVSGGLLGLLPLHAAWAEDAGLAAGRRYVVDSLAVSYVPNARSLAAARRLSGRAAKRLIAVSDPSPKPLPFAAPEVNLAAQSFDESSVLGAPSSDLSKEASIVNVLAALRDADVAHFACHGLADLENPLDSRLSLAHGDFLTLRDLLSPESQPLHLRLAVLSACETSLPGTHLPDEVVSLPSGLLQAGVGGVVASLWDVHDRQTTTLMMAFYWQWRHKGEEPPVALQLAQNWARRTTNQEKLDFLQDAVEARVFSAEAVDPICAQLYREPNPRSDAAVSAWGAFSYVGA